MKILVTIARVFTGVLFIFSGLVKAIDPKGLAYKMQEFFEAWSNAGFLPSLMHFFDAHALAFSIIMITVEVFVGVALLLGWQKKISIWILLLLMLLFTFLTSYVLFSGKIRACGCFGDCIPLTPIQTFTKDIVLLVLVLFLLFNQKYITPILKPIVSTFLVLLATAMVLFLQWYVLKNLPLVDCLPYKPGNNILELRKMPENAVQDKFEYSFVYEKDGVKKEFKSSADSSWKFVERKQTLVQKGSNNVPIINDFSLTTESGNDSTEAILSTANDYYLMYIKDLEGYPKNWNGDANFIAKTIATNKKLYIVTSQVDKVKEHLKNIKDIQAIQFLSCDATVMKTVARVNPTLYLMHGAVVKQKWSWASFNTLQ
ncbi:MAG: BT_3928 family protein [Ferruginibacter sp.]|nr:DoxX family protein [Ferruginibacter sp.]